jgi:hypothetical protein
MKVIIGSFIVLPEGAKADEAEIVRECQSLWERLP